MEQEVKRKVGRPRRSDAENQLKRTLQTVANAERRTNSAMSGRSLVRAQDALRLQISNHHHVERLQSIQQKLYAGAESDALTAAQIAAYAKAAEISIRLLGKILPDLKTTEIVSAHNHGVTIDSIAEADRVAIDAAITQALGIARSEGVGGE